jgi:hypothetical protein
VLFLRAEAANKLNAKWVYWRIVGVILILLNWATLIAVCITRKSRDVTALDGTGFYSTFHQLRFA